MKLAPVFAVVLGLAATASGAAPTLAQMRDHRRVLILAAPRSDDAELLRQHRLIAEWGRGAADRDLSVVEVVGGRVWGAADDARALRRDLRLPAAGFTAILIGKDGHEAVRSAAPLSGRTLAGTIDAMPMRRAGGR